MQEIQKNKSCKKIIINDSVKIIFLQFLLDLIELYISFIKLSTFFSIFFIYSKQLKNIFNFISYYIYLTMKVILRPLYTFTSVPKWATVDPYSLSGAKPHTVANILDGKVLTYKKTLSFPDPLNGEQFLKVSTPQDSQLDGFIQSQRKVPKFGLHNPIRNVHRYNMYGDIFFKIAQQMRKPEVQNFFVKLIQRVMPKSTPQVVGEVVVTRRFFENFTGDNPRFLHRSFNVSGDHDGQTSSGYRWPYGNVCCITPFNFPIQIPCLQLYGALLAGNRPLLKCDNRMSVVMEQFLLFSHACGMPAEDVNFINCSNASMEKIIEKADFRVIQFTGSSQVAEHLAKKTNGKVRIQDAGFDWKVLGPDVRDLQYVSWQSDQDAYASSGQKCSAQSVVFVHQNWVKAGFIQKIKELAGRRNLQDLTVGPVITWSNQKIKSHIDQLLKITGAKVAFGGKPLQNHKIPEVYGAYEPTAVQVPLDQFVSNYKLCTKQLFGPFQMIVPYKDNQINTVIDCLNRMQHHLTAGVVSNDVLFLDKVLGQSVNGVTYCGIRARTTGAPQNHWFGPTGDPRGAGIGTKEAILHVWTSHRQIIRDYGPIAQNWKLPPPS